MKTKITIRLGLGLAVGMMSSGKAFSKDALVGNFRDITTFEKACEVSSLCFWC